MKTLEEVEELTHALADRNLAEIADAIGDIYVTLVIQAEMQGLRMSDCIDGAYNVISKRTGKMVNGQFVKDRQHDT
jgi:NTP pyrophosphatase (non-canonical NTP hydrolase)